MLRVASRQPGFIPWVGFWSRLAAVDLYVAVVGTQFTHHDEALLNRVRLNGSWLTVPVQRNGVQPFCGVRIVPGSLPKVFKTIRQTFGRRLPHSGRVQNLVDAVEETLSRHMTGDCEYLRLWEFNLLWIREVGRALDLSCRVSVNFDERSGPPEEKTLRLFRRVRDTVEVTFVGSHAYEYYAGSKTVSYMNRTQIPPAVVVWEQCVKPDNPYGYDSILHVLANERDPLGFLKQISTWRLSTETADAPIVRFPAP